jgi:hypothetical protein
MEMKKLKTYKIAKSLGLSKKIALEWAKETENTLLTEGWGNSYSHCGSNEFMVSQILGIDPTILSRVVSASYQKTGSGESVLIAYLNNQISYKVFWNWYEKYHKALLKGLKDGKKWAITGRVSHPISKKTGKYKLPYAVTYIFRKMEKEKGKKIAIELLGVQGYQDFVSQHGTRYNYIF